MQTNIAKLKGKLAEKGYNQSMLAEAMQLDKSTIYRKMETNGLSFTIREAHQIVDILNLTIPEAVEIFLSN